MEEAPFMKVTNFAKQTILMDNRNGWVYLQRTLIGLSATLSIYLVQNRVNSGSSGLLFFSYFLPVTFIFMSLAAISTFSSSIASEKEEGNLQLVLMTGISPLACISGRASGKAFQLFFLYLILIPSSLFAVTLGGISFNQILSAYIYLTFWLLFVSAISLWASVLCSNKKEALIISGTFCGLLFIAISIAGYSPISRLQEILYTADTSIIFHFYDMLLYSLTAAFFLYSSIKNFEIAVTNPLSFLNDYEQRVKNIERNKFLANRPKFINRKVNFRYFKNPISSKDIHYFPKANIFPQMSTAVSTVVYLLLSIFALITFVIPVLLLIGFWCTATCIIYTWNRTIVCFSHEIENKTLESLFLLPYSPQELLEEKLRGAKLYESPLKVIFVIVAVLSILILVSTQLWHSLLAIAGLPALYICLIYSTVLVTFKTQEMTKISSFILNTFLIIFYFAFPIITVPIAFLAIKVLKKMCIQEMEAHASG
jgi:hypothetical protein